MPSKRPGRLWVAGPRSHPKDRTGAVEAIRVLVVAKRSARQARMKALVQMRHLVITAPDQLNQRLKGLTIRALVDEGSFPAARAARVIR